MTKLNPNAIQDDSVAFIKLDPALQETLNTMQKTSTLVLRTYLFNADGSYSKQELENMLSVTLEELVTSISSGAPLIIMSKDATSGNLSFIVESNFTLLDETTRDVGSITLQWHQYSLWCNAYILYNESTDTFLVTITKA